MPHCRRTVWILFSLLLSAHSMTVSAYTDAEIDQMISALKAENSALKEEVKQLKEQSNSAQTAVLKEQVVTSNTQTQDPVISIKRSIEKQQSVFKINGFLSAGATKADPAVSDQNLTFKDDISFDTDSIVGLQTSFQLSADADVTVQMIARAADNWELEAEWAFLRYHLTEDLSFRAGRLRLPLYLFSESLDVGFSYPWVRPPSEIYALPISNYEGIDLLYTKASGDWVHQFQVFTGEDSDDNFQTSNFFGGNITSSSGPWTYRASAFRFDIEFSKFGGRELPPPLDTVEDGGTYYTLAGMYDDGNWLAITELSVFDTNQTIVFRNTDSGYITLGKYMGRLLPYATYAKSYTTSEPTPYTLFEIPLDPPVNIPFPPFIIDSIPVSSEALEFTGTSYSLGMRFNLTENTSAKFEWNHYTELDNTGGIWNSLRFNNEAKGVDDIDIYSVVLDVVF